MSLLDILGGILSGGDKKVVLNFRNFNSKNKKTKITAKKGGTVNVIQVNGPLTEDVIKQLAPIADGYQKKEILFLEEEASKMVSDTLEFEENPHIKSLLNAFKDIIPIRDFVLFRTGLYVGYLNSNDEHKEVSKITENLQLNNERERKVYNLASANYFSTYFRPLLKQFKTKHPNNFRRLFLEEYNNALEDLTFAIFVHKNMSKEQVVQDVIKRAVKNIRYGVRTETITIHAMGLNVRTVEDATKVLSGKFSKIRVKKPAVNFPVIRVKIYYSDNSLVGEDFMQYE